MKEMYLRYAIKETDVNSNIQDILKKKFGISARLYRKLVNEKAIRLNGTLIIINLNFEEDNSNIVPTKMKLNIIYEDEWMLIVDKPVGIPVHPSILHYEDSLSNGIRAYFDLINLKKRIRPVNRIDSNTSGLVVFAKCGYIHSVLSSQMQKKIFTKKYLAIVDGILNKKFGTIDLPIARKNDSIIERCVSKNGKPAITNYTVLKENSDYSLVECTLPTGRTHQIRIHMSAIGHPILGDSLYGKESDLVEGQALHSYYISFIHPVTKEQLEFTCEPAWELFE